MVAPIPNHNLILILGPARARWPDPLMSLIDANHVRIETYSSMHEIAARLAACDPGIRALVLDPQILTPRDLQAVATIARYIRLPVALLPLLQGASTCARNAHSPAILSWEEAAPGFHALAESSGTPPQIHPVPPAPARLPVPAAISPPPTDNRPLAIADEQAENSVTLDAPNRYDGMGIEPLISPQEMAALLGVNK